MWQLTPRQVVTDLAFQSQIKPISNLPEPAPAPGSEVPRQLQQGQPVELRMGTQLKAPATPLPEAPAAMPSQVPAK